jgi:hypothetical protein
LRKVLKGLADYESSINIISSSRAAGGGSARTEAGSPLMLNDLLHKGATPLKLSSDSTLDSPKKSTRNVK